MIRLATLIVLFLAACAPTSQPASARTVAAYEIPLPTAEDKSEFLELLARVAKESGYHVDAANAEALEAMSGVSAVTFSASVWRGDDVESIASAMDYQDRIGRVWISFSKGKFPHQSKAFHDRLMPQVKRRWPETATLPIMPSGAIPLTEDLIRDGSSYRVKPSAAVKYN